MGCKPGSQGSAGVGRDSKSGRGRTKWENWVPLGKILQTSSYRTIAETGVEHDSRDVIIDRAIADDFDF